VCRGHLGKDDAESVIVEELLMVSGNNKEVLHVLNLLNMQADMVSLWVLASEVFNIFFGKNTNCCLLL
jgi:hypothetical protein